MVQAVIEEKCREDKLKPGISIWYTGEESRFPSIPYVIFPGNVGEETTLKEAVEVLLRQER